ncbi:MAG: GGDEF domain-containing protein [bacterium]
MNANPIRFKIYLIFIISSLIAFFVGIFRLGIEKYSWSWYLFFIPLSVSVVLVLVNITDSKNYMKNLESLNKKLNLLNDLSYKLSMVFSLEYAIKTFAEGLYLIKKDKGGRVDSLHINIFDTVNKKTVTSLIYTRKENESADAESSGKVLVFTHNINYEDYILNCKLLEKGRKKNDTVNDCEFRGTEGSYTCFSLKISDEVAGTISVDSKDKDFFTEEITALIKEIINIASPVFAKLLLIETNKELAITDPLTGIYNRRYMYEFAKREVIRAYRNKTYLSIAILDIDKFKNINDNYGHQAGDYVLKEFVTDLKNILMRKQDIITRYGGDEFVMILPDTDKRNTVDLMEKLRTIIKNKAYIVENNISLNIAVSIGVSGIEYPLDGNIIKNKDISDDILNYLLRAADDNLYKAKDSGRDRVVG